MANLLGQTSLRGWHQALHRSDIQHVLHSGALIHSLTIDEAGHIDFRVCDWDAYWDDAARQDNQLHLWLDHLHAVRKQYLDDDYRLDRAIPYCQSYFELLRNLLMRPDKHDALRALIGLESFGIGWSGCEGFQAAGTITIRNPVYLLAKLREPKAYEDAKFLPVICPQSPALDENAAWFYYYRQIKIQSAPDASLLIYPSVDLSRRSDSFGCIEAVSLALSFKPDPRSRQRGESIADWAVAPFLESQRSIQRGRAEVSFVDLGGGSGALLAEICKRLVREHGPVLGDRKFSWSIVDVSPQDASRRTQSRELRPYMSYLEYLPAEYARWIVEECRDGHPKYNLALVCRLLNNLSSIEIEFSSDPNVIAELSTVRKRPAPDITHPADCLAGRSPDCRSLVASNSRIRLHGGTTFRQASLSDYFRALHRIRHGSLEAGERALYFPVRRFHEEALILPDDSSMLDRLCQLAGMVVIEDVDLHAEVLIDHLKKRGLDHLAASDATDRVRMQSASLLCVCSRELETALPGRQIW